MLESLHIRGYRSLRDFRLTLGRLTVVTGRNGVGKSNLYRALFLIQRMAEGRFAETLAAEGGMPHALWAGPRRKDEAKRLVWNLRHSDFEWSAMDEIGRFQLTTSKPEIQRQFSSAELSDGTLRFFCLCAALITEKLPPFLVLNEPETSLHADLIPALAALIAKVPESTQLLVVTHSMKLAEEIAAQGSAKIVELVDHEGETRTKETAGSKRAWTFDE